MCIATERHQCVIFCWQQVVGFCWLPNFCCRSLKNNHQVYCVSVCRSFFCFYTILLGFYMISPCFSIFSLSGPVWSGACDRYQIGKASLRYLILMAVEPSHGTNCGKDDGRVLLFYELKGQIAFFASPCLQRSILSFSFEKLCQTATECVWLHWIYFILGS